MTYRKGVRGEFIHASCESVGAESQRTEETHSVTLSAVNKLVCMVGSYAPRVEEQEFLCPADEAPEGLVNRGQYQIKSCFIDDDKNVHLSWEWNLNISKDWN